MSQQLIKGAGGTVETYILDRQVASCTVSIYSGLGAAKLTGGTCTVDSVSTTLSSSATPGDTTLDLTSVTGVVAGRRYLIGASSAAQAREEVTIQSIASLTATLWAPILYPHDILSTFKGTRVSYSASSTVADELWWDGYADFIPSSGDTQTETVDCVLRKITENLITETDIYDVLPKARGILDAELDLPRALRSARDEFLRDLGGKFRVHCMLGTEHLRRACALMFWLQRRHTMGAEWAAVLDGIERDYDREKQKLQTQIPVDADQDGVTQGANDGGISVIRVERA